MLPIVVLYPLGGNDGTRATEGEVGGGAERAGGAGALVATAASNSIAHSVFPAGSRLGLSVHNEATLVVSDTDEYQLPLIPTLPNTFPFETKQPGGELDVALSPSGVLTGLRCRPISATECDVEIAVDSDADLELEDETGIFIVSLDFDSSTHIKHPTLASSTFS